MEKFLWTSTKILLVIILALFSLLALAAPPDLEGAILETQGICLYNRDALQCAVYEKKGVKYLIYAAGGQIVLIYRIKDGATEPYGPADTTLLWQRGGKKGKEA